MFAETSGIQKKAGFYPTCGARSNKWSPELRCQDVNGEQILHQEMFVLQERGAEEEHTLNFTVPITEPLPPQQLGLREHRQKGA